MDGHRADEAVALADHGDGKEGLESLVLELGHALGTWILVGPLADERRLASLGCPPGQSLAPLEHDLVDEVPVRLGRGLEDEPLLVGSAR